MKRRTLIRQLGSAALASTAVAGTSMAADSSVDLSSVDIPNVDEPTLLVDLLDDDELAALDDDVDPTRIRVVGDAGQLYDVDDGGPHYEDPYACAIGCCETPLQCPSDCTTCSCVNCYP